MSLFSLFYDLALHLYFLASLPKIVLGWKKYRGSFKQRLGFGFPKIEKKDKKLIWIHAVSLGETKAVCGLIQKFKSLPNPPLIMLSSTTATGHAEGIKNAGADFHLFLPFDFKYVIAPKVERAAPDLVIITETDFWYNFQRSAKKVGAKVVVVNGKISQRSTNRLKRLPFFAHALFESIDHFYLQSALYEQRFKSLKIPPHRLTVTGNLKLDTPPEPCDRVALKQRLGLTSQFVLTLGSTHDPEERIWCNALKQLWLDFPDLKVLLVPRHPERFQKIAQLLTALAIPFSRWSEEGTLQTHPLLLVDAMGALGKCYQICDLAFVGGSLTDKIGGHNLLEPVFYAKPILFGPHLHAQPHFSELIQTHKAGLQISLETLQPILHTLLSEPGHLQQLSENGQKLIATVGGALARTFNLLQDKI